MAIHSCFQTSLYILSKSIRSHGNDGNISFYLIRESPNGPGGITAVHNRHLDIHQNRVIRICFGIT